MSDKIQATHLQRQAAIYLRQSTLRQVVQHGESTARQYGLRQRAVELGWPSEQVVVIDEDLGVSGTSTESRTGFQHLAEAVAHGQIGAIFALEASRLARRSADWHRLLDLCRLADVIIADDQAVYTPRDYNDQLLLGLKGTMAEAEIVWMRRRMQGGKLSKARRGALYQNPPTGYVWDGDRERFVFDPDEHVQQAVQLVFERFRIEGSARGVVRYFVQKALPFPGRDSKTCQRRWTQPNPSTITAMLHNPIYAGVYTFGRTEERTALVDGQIRRRHVLRLPQESWKAMLRDHHRGYIKWDEYMANQRKLYENRTNHTKPDQRGAARNGDALLQGLALCGRCGSRMRVLYKGTAEQRRGSYLCEGRRWKSGQGSTCWSASARAIDEEVSRLVLQAINPGELDLSLAVAHQVEQQAQQLHQQWKLRFDRLEYDARLAERRYKAVDPDNRVVARTLEADWEKRLRDLEAARQEYDRVRQQQHVELTERDRARVLELARDLPALWHARTTTMRERKTLLRLVVKEVALSPVDVPKRSVRVQIQWETGTVTESVVALPPPVSPFVTSADAQALVRHRFESGDSDQNIAALLDAQGLKTGRGRKWSAPAVALMRHNLGLYRPQGPPTDRRADGLHSTRGVAAHFGVSTDTVHRWVELGWLVPEEKGGGGRPSWFQLTPETCQRIEGHRQQKRTLSSRCRNPVRTEEVL